MLVILNQGNPNSRDRRPVKGNHAFYLHRRSAAVAVGSEAFHTVPAGMFQPAALGDPNPERDCNIKRNVLRELAEELLGRPELMSLQNKGEDFLQDPRMRPWLDALEHGDARMLFFGLGLDPVGLGPLVLSGLVVDAARASCFAKMEWIDNIEGKNFRVDFEISKIDDYIGRRATLPETAACLMMARAHFDAIKSCCQQSLR